MKKTLFLTIILLTQTNLYSSFLKESALIFVRSAADKVIFSGLVIVAYRYGLIGKAFKYCTKIMIKEVMSEENISHKAEVDAAIAASQRKFKIKLDNHIEKTIAICTDLENRVSKVEVKVEDHEQRLQAVEWMVMIPKHTQGILKKPNVSESKPFDPTQTFTSLRYKIPQNPFSVSKKQNSLQLPSTGTTFHNLFTKTTRDTKL